MEDKYKKAIDWLVQEGYTVSRTEGGSLLVTKNDKSTEVEIKELLAGTKDFWFSWSAYLSQDKIRQGIRPLFVHKDTVGWNRDYF